MEGFSERLDTLLLNICKEDGFEIKESLQAWPGLIALVLDPPTFKNPLIVILNFIRLNIKNRSL